MASNEIRRGAAEMSMAMLMSGTIGWLVVSSQQSPFNVVFFRCIFGGATLALVCAVLGLFRRKLFSWKMLGLALLGGAAIVINWLLLFAAYSRASISMATAVYNTQPFMLVALGALVFRERISASTVVWLVVASGANRVDEKKVAAQVGEIGRADAKFVREKTGYAIGGVCPIGHATEPVTLIDADLLTLDSLWAAAGHPHAVFNLTAQELIALTGAPVIDVALRETA